MHSNTASVWVEEAPAQVSPKKLPGLKMLAATATLAMVLAVGGCAWAYVSGLQSLHAAVAQIADNIHSNPKLTASKLLDSFEHAAFQLMVTAVISGVGLFLVTLFSGQWLAHRWHQRYRDVIVDSDTRAQRLMAQIADAKVSEEEAIAGKAEVETRLSNASQRQATLERELAQKKLAEKSLAEQAQQLERSKDVLEMHVQARTVELQKMQRRNEMILNSAGDGICGFDLQGRATFVNPAVARLTGWKVEDLAGKFEDAIFFPPKRGTAKDAPGLLKDAAGNYFAEQTFHRKDGSTFPVAYVRTPIKENNVTVGTVVMFKDITEHRQAEDKLNKKAAELARSNQELEQFAFVASHDLQEPLRKIQAFGDRLKTKCESVQLDEGKDYLERMQSAAARMQILINDLLTYSRVISSSQPFVPVDLGAVTKEVLVDLEVRIEKTQAIIEVTKLPTLPGDPTQMRQLLQNLIGNALKFQSPHAVPKIKIEGQLITRDQISEDTPLPKPAPTDLPDDKFCLLTVQDNGIGFDEQYLEKVFAVFQRLHGRSEYKGTGVGLAVCRRIAERHGGIITAQSKPGEGSVFIVILPMQQPTPTEPK